MASIPMDSTHSGGGFKTICNEFGLKILYFEKKMFVQTDILCTYCSDGLSVRIFLNNVCTDRFSQLNYPNGEEMTGEAGLFASIYK